MEEKKARVMAAIGRIKQEVRECHEETGLGIQVYADSDSVGFFNAYEKEEGKMPSLPEAMDAMVDYVERVERKGQLGKPEQLEMANKFKRLITKYRGE